MNFDKRIRQAISILIVVLAISLAVWLIHSTNKRAVIPTHVGKCYDPAIAAVIYSIQTDPDSWETDNFRMSRGYEVSVWTANADYGLNVQVGADASPGDKEIMSDECKQLLYITTKTWYNNYLNEKLRS